MKIALLIVAALISIVVIVALIGFALPANHVARTRTSIKASPDEVWSAITDIEKFPSWRSDVKTVGLSPDSAGKPKWVEEGSNGKISYIREEAVRAVRLKVRLTDDSLPFGGTWTYDITPTPGGTDLTITENGVVRNSIFRFVSRFIFGHYKTQETYLMDLGRKFSETLVPVRLTD